MKRVLMTVSCLCLLICFLVSSSAFAQLIIADGEHKVVKVDTIKNRIEITSVESKPDNTAGYIYVDGNTTTTKNGKLFDWKKLKKGWIIRVKGGVRFDMNVNAREIFVIKTDTVK
ncbi:MAG: hypothetical protein ACLFQV_09065 [Vulcanimicrobiota bacterium]